MAPSGAEYIRQVKSQITEIDPKEVSGSLHDPHVTVIDVRAGLLSPTLRALRDIGFIEAAKKNLIKVPIMNGTIPHDQLAKDGAAKVLIKPAAPGTGVIAGGSMRAVLESAGITDVLAKNLGSANPANVVKATVKALATLREPIAVAKARNISLKKVFNG